MPASIPRSQPSPMIADRRRLVESRERHDLMRRLALVEMQGLYHQISGSNFLIALADPEGMVLDILTDETFSETARERHIEAGGLWDEPSQGTNALGLTVACGRASGVHGGEHFFSVQSGLTCAAAPILAPTGELLGVLDASSDCRSRQHHTMALVKMAARQVETLLFRDLHRQDLVLIFHNRPEYLRTMSAGLLALDPEGRVIALNRQAAFFLQGLPAGAGAAFDMLFAGGFEAFLDGSFRGDTVTLVDRTGSRYAAMLDNPPAALSLRRGLSTAASRLAPPPRPAGFVAEDPVVASALDLLQGAVERRLPVLVRGQTGTGKELLARHAHALSGRSGAFVPVNCAALPEQLIEAELFGYGEGAFTGARRGGARGLVAEADGGTLFLDEIGDMPLALQGVLLRLLDDWTVRPVGSGKERRVDIQLVSATNVDLAHAVATGRFRADLLYRLNTIEIELPPLARRADFLSVARHLLAAAAPGTRITEAALERLRARDWPGNMRELRAVLTRLAIAAPDGVVDAGQIEAAAGSPGQAAASPPPELAGACRRLPCARRLGAQRPQRRAHRPPARHQPQHGLQPPPRHRRALRPRPGLCVRR